MIINFNITKDFKFKFPFDKKIKGIIKKIEILNQYNENNKLYLKQINNSDSCLTLINNYYIKKDNLNIYFNSFSLDFVLEKESKPITISIEFY